MLPTFCVRTCCWNLRITSGVKIVRQAKCLINSVLQPGPDVQYQMNHHEYIYMHKVDLQIPRFPLCAAHTQTQAQCRYKESVSTEVA